MNVKLILKAKYSYKTNVNNIVSDKVKGTNFVYHLIKN